MNIAFPARLVAACVVAVSCYTSRCLASSDYLLEIDGIAGDSKTSGGIDIIAFSHDVKGPRDPSSGLPTGRLGTEKINMSDLSLSCGEGKSSPLLLKGCVGGTHYKKATLTCSHSSGDGTSQPYLIIVMQDCVISSFSSTGNSGDDRPVETFSLNFTKIEFNYIDSAGNPTKLQWDLAKGTKV